MHYCCTRLDESINPPRAFRGQCARCWVFLHVSRMIVWRKPNPKRRLNLPHESTTSLALMSPALRVAARGLRVHIPLHDRYSGAQRAGVHAIAGVPRAGVQMPAGGHPALRRRRAAHAAAERAGPGCARVAAGRCAGPAAPGAQS